MPPTPTRPTLQSAILLNRMLCLGVFGFLAVAVLLYSLGIAPLRLQFEEPFPLAYIFAGLGIAPAGIGFILRGRVPRSFPGASLESHWAKPGTHQAALLSWFLIEGGAILGILGFILTGDSTPAAVGIAAFLALLFSSPQRLTPEVR